MVVTLIPLSKEIIDIPEFNFNLFCLVCSLDIIRYGCKGTGRVPRSALLVEVVDHTVCNRSGMIPYA